MRWIDAMIFFNVLEVTVYNRLGFFQKQFNPGNSKGVKLTPLVFIRIFSKTLEFFG